MQNMSRRAFLRTSVAASIGLGVMGLSPRSMAQADDFVPACIIGAGYGAGVAAWRLAQAGIQAVVLERGRRWPIQPSRNTFATFDAPDGRASWLSPRTPIATLELLFGIQFPPLDIFTGVLEAIDGNGITCLAGSGVGGGSLHNNKIAVRPRQEIFQLLFPNTISFKEMEEVYYPRAESVLKPAPIPPDILATPFFQSTRVNFEQATNAHATNAGYETRIVNLTIDWDVVREEINGTKVPSAIAGQSWYGLNSGAGRSLDRPDNYLGMAEATGLVEILPLHEVVSIGERGSSGLYVVSANEIDEQGKIVALHRFTTRHLFLAAGSIGTSKLLVKAKATGTLPRLNNHVGQNFAGNGDFVIGRVGLPDMNPGTGGPAGHFIAEFLTNPFGPCGLIELVTPHHIAQRGGPGISSYVGMGLHPQALGSLTYDPTTDKVNVNFPSLFKFDLAPFIASTQATLDTLNKANPPSMTQSNAPFFSVHPLGGATVGAVCDDFGRVFNHRGLYVVDGAFVPGFAGIVNPFLTITALAERSVEHIIAEDMLR
jgi:cholesterol oxidase